MIEPKAVGGTMGFRLRNDASFKIYSLKELVARVKDGGRTDVDLGVSGDVRHGLWDEARALIKRAGLTVVLTEALPSPLVRAGFSSREDTRGQYWRRFQ